MSRHSRRSPARAALSQHFLRESAVERIIASTGLAPPRLVFDLGAGDGALTAAVAARDCRIVAVELDRLLWQRLKHRFHGDQRVEVVLADLLRLDLPHRAPYTVVSNPPFGLTARLMRRLQELANPPRDAWLVLQEEAARKWAGLGHETPASLSLKLQFEVEVVLNLRRSDFVPRPAVDSVVLHLRRRPEPVLAGPDARHFAAIVRHAFAGPGSARARELSFDEWVMRFPGGGRRRRLDWTRR